MNNVLDWVKHNVLIVIFIVLTVAAIAVGPYFAGKMNAAVRDDVEKRARKASDLKKLEIDITGPGIAPTRGLVNQRLLDQYSVAAKSLRADAEEIISVAERHNRKGRTVVFDAVLPTRAVAQASILTRKFHEQLDLAYDGLLADVKAVQPPTDADIFDELNRAEVQYRQQIMNKDIDEALSDEEAKDLAEKLSEIRMAKYVDAAEQILLYVSPTAINRPRFDVTQQVSQFEIYERQWDLWITEDILRALAMANQDDQSVLTGPVKRVVSLMPGFVDTKDGNSDIKDGAPNPKAAAPLNYGVSFTGRQTNPLYDVRTVSLQLVVDSVRIPQVLDAIADYNFMTVLSMKVRAADPHADVRQGYVYGAASVALLELEVETVWFRSWTLPFMPDEFKSAVGAPVETPDDQGNA